MIKPLGKLFQHVRGIAGSKILGSGGVALILDVAALVGIVARGGPVRPAVAAGARAGAIGG